MLSHLELDMRVVAPLLTVSTLEQCATFTGTDTAEEEQAVLPFVALQAAIL